MYRLSSNSRWVSDIYKGIPMPQGWRVLSTEQDHEQNFGHQSIWRQQAKRISEWGWFASKNTQL